MSVNDKFNVPKDTVIAVTVEVVGYKVRKNRKKGNAWWTDEIKRQ